jgi:hypothetical protein
MKTDLDLPCSPRSHRMPIPPVYPSLA